MRENFRLEVPTKDACKSCCEEVGDDTVKDACNTRCETMFENEDSVSCSSNSDISNDENKLLGCNHGENFALLGFTTSENSNFIKCNADGSTEIFTVEFDVNENNLSQENCESCCSEIGQLGESLLQNEEACSKSCTTKSLESCFTSEIPPSPIQKQSCIAGFELMLSGELFINSSFTKSCIGGSFFSSPPSGSEDDASSGSFPWQYLFYGIGGGLLVLIILGIVVFAMHRRRKQLYKSRIDMSIVTLEEANANGMEMDHDDLMFASRQVRRVHENETHGEFGEFDRDIVPAPTDDEDGRLRRHSVNSKTTHKTTTSASMVFRLADMMRRKGKPNARKQERNGTSTFSSVWNTSRRMLGFGQRRPAISVGKIIKQRTKDDAPLVLSPGLPMPPHQAIPNLEDEDEEIPPIQDISGENNEAL